MADLLWSQTVSEAKAALEFDARWGRLMTDINVDAAAREAGAIPIPRRFFTRAGLLGLQALPLPPSVGGEALDPVSWSLALERIGYLCQDSGFPLVLGFRAIIAQALFETGRPDVIERYVKPVARGTLGIAMAYSEDADAFSFRTTLRRTAAGYLLAGHKDFMTGGLQADVILTYARTEDDDMVACLVHKDDPGVHVTPLAPVGTRTSGPAALDLHDVPLPEERIVASVDGLSHAQRLLNARRLTVSCAPVGRARALVELCVARLNTTVRHGQKLGEFPNVQGALGRMYISVEAARAMLYRAAQRVADGEADPLFDSLVSAAKNFIAEQVRSVLDETTRVLGGYFYYGDPYFGTCMRDFAGLVAVAGTQDILEVNLGSLVRTHTPPRVGSQHDNESKKEGPLP